MDGKYFNDSLKPFAAATYFRSREEYRTVMSKEPPAFDPSRPINLCDTRMLSGPLPSVFDDGRIAVTMVQPADVNLPGKVAYQPTQPQQTATVRNFATGEGAWVTVNQWLLCTWNEAISTTAELGARELQEDNRYLYDYRGDTRRAFIAKLAGANDWVDIGEIVNRRKAIGAKTVWDPATRDWRVVPDPEPSLDHPVAPIPLKPGVYRWRTGQLIPVLELAVDNTKETIQKVIDLLNGVLSDWAA